MSKNTIIAGVLVTGIVVAGVYFYQKMKTTTVATPAAGSSAALQSAGVALGTSAARDFLTWLTAPGANTGSANSTSGTDTTGNYTDTGLNDFGYGIG